jgi:hypothetical protein
MAKLRDSLWLWGQDTGSHHAVGFGLPGKNLMGPAEGGRFFGIPNICRVVMPAGPEPPFDAESEKLRDFKQVVWSAVGSAGVERNDDGRSDLEEVLRQATLYPNITGAILDDFFLSEESADGNKKTARHSLESIRSMRRELHNFPLRRLDLWVVWYSHQLNLDVSDYITLCDVITLWTWKGSDLSVLDENLQRFVEKTPGKRRLAGCYMWNYGESRPLTMSQMKHQIDRYYNYLKKGLIEGIIFCSNCIADLGLETVEWTKNWIKEVGDEDIEVGG